MRIENYGAVYHAIKPEEIEKILWKRHGDGVSAFWLSHGSEKFPVLIIMIKGDLASLHYLPEDRHPGFVSIGPLDDLESGETTTFFLNSPTAPEDVVNDTILPFSDALRAAQEFATSSSLPKSIEWDEL
jgi:hypothetical protein